MSRLAEAERVWRDALKRDPNAEEARKGLARLEQERWAVMGSEPYAEAVQELYEAGMKAYRREHWLEAEEALARADALLPNDGRIQRPLDVVRVKLGKHVPNHPSVKVPTKILADVTLAAVEVDPPPVKQRPVKRVVVTVDTAKVAGLYRQGMKAYRAKRYEEALGLWRKVLALQPDHEKAVRNVERLEQMVHPPSSERPPSEKPSRKKN